MIRRSGPAEQVRAENLPVIVKPGAVTGDDDVVSLLRHIVLTGIHQAVRLRLALLLIVLWVASGER